MLFEKATFARSGRSVRIADPSVPYQITLAWLCCLYFYSYELAWSRQAAVRVGAVERKNKLHNVFLTAMLEGTSLALPADIERYRPHGQNPKSFLELARDIEAHVTPFGPLTTPSDSRVFLRSNASHCLDAPGFARGMFAVAEMFHMMNGWTSCLFNAAQGRSIASRLEPHLDELTGAGSPGALYARELAEHLASWDEPRDRALVFHP